MKGRYTNRIYTLVTEENLQEPILFFYHEFPRDKTEVIGMVEGGFTDTAILLNHYSKEWAPY